MKFLESLNKISYKKIRFAYIISMLFFLLMRYIVVYALLPKQIDSFLFSFLAFFGLSVCFFGVFLKKIEINLKENFWLFTFLAIFLISATLNFRYGFLGNMRTFVWALISFLVLFLPPKDELSSEKEEIITKIQNALVVFCLIVSSLSLLTFVFQINYSFPINERDIFCMGYVESRLCGVFTNPNRGSAIAFLSAIFSAFALLPGSKNNFFKKIHIFNLIIQYFYIVLADSRGTFLSLMVAFAVFFYVFLSKNFFGRSKRGAIFRVCVTLLFCAAFYFSFALLREAFCLIPKFMTRGLIKSGRKDFLNNSDISNLRFSLWLSAFEMFKEKWLFGVSPASVLQYAKDRFPSSVIAVKNYSRIHNAYFDLLISTGFLGFLTMMYFYVKSFFEALNFYTKNRWKVKNQTFNSCVLTLLSLAIYALTESEFLFVNTALSFVFWVFLGYTLSYAKKEMKVKKYD